MKESQIQTACLKYLRANGFFCWKNHVQGIRIGNRTVVNPAKGSPDILAIKEGVFYGIEVKTQTGRLSLDQWKWHKQARDVGKAHILVVRSVDELIDKLSELC